MSDFLGTVETLFFQLCDLPSSAQQQRLDAIGTSNPKLRAMLEGLLGADQSPDALLDHPVDVFLGGPSGTALDAHEHTDAAIEELARPLRPSERYLVREQIGRGGMGSVFRVHDVTLRRDLAMKVIDRPASSFGPADKAHQEGTARFLREARVLAQLDHPGIVPIHDLGVNEEQRPFFTMKLVQQCTLADVLAFMERGDSRWSRTRVLEILIRVCEAIAYAHDRGVIHRDLKPSNVMVGQFGEVYVMDWGVAKLLDERDAVVKHTQHDAGESQEQASSDSYSAAPTDSPLLTAQGQSMGTLAYMPPEQARGDLAAMGPQSDVYSMGATLYQLLVGFAPYMDSERRLEPRQMIASVVDGRPTSLNALASRQPGELIAVCEKAMSREPSERYGSMRELLDDLRAFLDSRVVKAHRTGPTAELRKWVTRNRAFAGACGVIGVLLFGGLIAFSSVQAKAKSDVEAQRDTASKEAQIADRATVIFNTVMSTNFSPSITRPDRIHLLEQTAAEVLHDPTLDARRQALLLVPTGQALCEQGELEKGREVVLQGLNCWRSLAKREFESEFATLNVLGLVETKLGKKQEAEQHFEQALEAAKNAKLPTGDAVALVYSNLADLLIDENNLAGAEKYLDELTRWFETVQVTDGPMIAATLNKLGRIQRRQRKLVEAEDSFRKGIAMLSNHWPPDHPAVMSMGNNLATTILEEGRATESLEIISAVISRAENAYAPEDPELSVYRETYCADLFAVGRFSDLEEPSRAILDLRRIKLATDDPRTLRAEVNLASVLLELGRIDEAEPLLAHALPAYAEQNLDGSADQVSALTWMGRLWAEQHRYDAARTALQVVVEHFQAVGLNTDRKMLEVAEDLARVELALGNFEAARRAASIALDGTQPTDAQRATRQGLVDEIARKAEASPHEKH